MIILDPEINMEMFMPIGFENIEWNWQSVIFFAIAIPLTLAWTAYINRDKKGR